MAAHAVPVLPDAAGGGAGSAAFGASQEAAGFVSSPSAANTAAAAYPAAPRVRRFVAALIDLLVGAMLLFLFQMVPLWIVPFAKSNLLVKLVRFLPAFYLLLRDSLGGRSVGKAFMGLVTYDCNLRRPANVVDSVVRNWPLALTLIPWVGWVLSGVFSIVVAVQILLGARQRFGDGFAATQVVDEKWLRTEHA